MCASPQSIDLIRISDRMNLSKSFFNTFLLFFISSFTIDVIHPRKSWVWVGICLSNSGIAELQFVKTNQQNPSPKFKSNHLISNRTPIFQKLNR